MWVCLYLFVFVCRLLIFIVYLFSERGKKSRGLRLRTKVWRQREMAVDGKKKYRKADRFSSRFLVEGVGTSVGMLRSSSGALSARLSGALSFEEAAGSEGGPATEEASRRVKAASS